MNQVPIFGYHKASYICIAAAGATLAFLMLAAVPPQATLAVGLFFLGHLAVTVVDLLCEVCAAHQLL